MAALATAAPGKLTSLDFWHRFCARLEQQLRECNVIAGENVWEASIVPGPSLHCEIRCRTCPTGRVDCWFDWKNGILSCTRGTKTEGTYRFQWVRGTADLLRRGTEEYTLAQTLVLILDQLTWPDD